MHLFLNCITGKTGNIAGESARNAGNPEDIAGESARNAGNPENIADKSAKIADKPSNIDGGTSNFHSLKCRAK